MKASVMPVVQVGHGNNGADGTAWIMTINAHDTGLVPAEIRCFGMSRQGRRIADTSDFLAACCAPDSVPPDQRIAFTQIAFRNGAMSMVFDGC